MVNNDGKRDAAEPPRRITWRKVALENEILTVLDAKPGPDETFELAFRRKEQELMAVFARLDILDSMELHRRLSLCLFDDPIASRFARLVVQRRTRLLSFLASARRREALQRRR